MMMIESVWAVYFIIFHNILINMLSFLGHWDISEKFSDGLSKD